jgi:glycine/D-amino acid oxidase-like deaminating enzyme
MQFSRPFLFRFNPNDVNQKGILLSKRVIVIGAGIIGASIAWYLAKAGADVTVVEAGEAGGVATPNSWAWINASWGNPEAYFRLRQRSMQEWKQMDRDVPGLNVDWCGGLLWDLPPDKLEDYAREYSALGYGIQRVSRDEILQIEPNIQQAPDWALHVAEEGKVEPLPTALAFLAGAQALGATVLSNTPVRWLEEKNARVTGIAINDGVLHADEVVIAAGQGTPALLESIGFSIDLVAPPGLLVHSVPCRELLHGLVMAPELHVRQTSEGRLVAGSDFSGTVAVDDVDAAAMELYDKVQAMVAGAEQVVMDFHTLGYRPTPADGFPMIGRTKDCKGLYLTVMHSGVTLAPAVGLFTARELLDNKRDELIVPYHPDRLVNTPSLAAKVV